MGVSTSEATLVTTGALLIGLAVGWCLGWFRGYQIAARQRRLR